MLQKINAQCVEELWQLDLSERLAVMLFRNAGSSNFRKTEMLPVINSSMLAIIISEMLAVTVSNILAVNIFRNADNNNFPIRWQL